MAKGVITPVGISNGHQKKFLMEAQENKFQISRESKKNTQENHHA